MYFHDAYVRLEKIYLNHIIREIFHIFTSLTNVQNVTSFLVV